MDAELFWNKVKQRLSELEKRQGWLCEQTGLNLQSLRDQISKHRLPSLDDSMKIVSALHLSWEEFTAYPEPIAEKTDKSMMIPVCNQAFSAGNGQLLHDFDEVSEYISIPKRLQHLKGHLMGAYVRGDSMEPNFSDGDTFICDDLGYNGNDGVYAIHYRGKSYIKRLQNNFDNGIKIISDNPNYAPFYVTNEGDEFRVIGKVHCVLHIV
jgi:hypothetical protein